MGIVEPREWGGAIWEDYTGHARVTVYSREPLATVSPPPNRGAMGLWGDGRSRFGRIARLGTEQPMVPMAPLQGGANTVARRLAGAPWPPPLSPSVIVP